MLILGQADLSAASQPCRSAVSHLSRQEIS
jgi:hypothetical protein